MLKGDDVEFAKRSRLRSMIRDLVEEKTDSFMPVYVRFRGATGGAIHMSLLGAAEAGSFPCREEPKKLIQASMRRPVSASYHALFHLLVDEVTKLMLTGNVRGPLRDSHARAFHHSTMKQTGVAFSKGSIPRGLHPVWTNKRFNSH